MPKKDVALTISAADRLLEVTTNPLHRRILENYRRHAILEVTGEWEGIFSPEMSVPEPIYRYNIAGFEGVVADGAAPVQKVYRMLAETRTGVIVVEDERLAVADWGFASEALFNTYLRGNELGTRGLDAGNPDGFYVLRQRFAMIWPYDARGRMLGEHVYEDHASREVVPIPEDEYITLEEARARLLPLLRPLTPFAPAAAAAG